MERASLFTKPDGTRVPFRSSIACTTVGPASGSDSRRQTRSISTDWPRFCYSPLEPVWEFLSGKLVVTTQTSTQQELSKVSHKQRSYTSEISEGQWQRLKWLLPKGKGAGRPIELDLRRVINAIFYLMVTGCQWRNLPQEYPNPNSVYYHYRKWCLDGTWQRINRALVYLERRRSGRFARPSAAILDSQSVKISDMGGVSGYDGNKKVKGRKRHLLVDTLGNLLEVVVSAANLTDVEGARLLISKVERLILARLWKLWADQSYQGEWETWLYNQWHIQLEIVRAEVGQHGFAVQPRRWVVERTFAWLGKYRRLSKDYERSIGSSEGLIYLASIRTMLKRLPA